MMNALKWTGRIAVTALAVLLSALLVFLGGLNLAKYGIYKDYYAMESDLCKNPGLSDGFVCQGVAVSEAHEVVLVSGYMKDKSASRIYVIDENGDAYYVELSRAGKVYTGHAGGIATTGNTVYLANGGRIFTFPLATLLTAKAGSTVEIGEGTKVNTNASFVYTDENYLYVGEFHDGGAYVIEGHENETAEGTHYALCTKYAIGDLSTPVAVYSIRNKVQGICFTPEGKVVMSTSYGLADTVYYVYDESKATPSGKTVDGAPLYYLDHLEKEVKGPAMGEDLDYYDGTVVTLTESASDKYIFGKLFGADRIVRLTF
ncbi:MAG: hypothetical protein IJW51_02660 [Clostridia bacterium]|nr:hypothetical protein [Clostridia bacterium]